MVKLSERLLIKTSRILDILIIFDADGYDQLERYVEVPVVSFGVKVDIAGILR